MAANAVAPFIMCGALRPALAASASDQRWGHIINVSALEGMFSPHFNPILTRFQPHFDVSALAAKIALK